MAGTVSFAGTFTALVTPFEKGGDPVDWKALEELVEGQIEAGITGLLPCGTTGETPTLSDREQVEVIQRVAEIAAGRVSVVAGTGSNDTKKTIAASKAALEAGADAVMIVMPYYNKPSQAGMREHVLAIARAVDAPIIIYNIPGRCGVDLAADTTEAICEAATNVVAVKDASGNVLRCQEVVRRLGERLTVMSGDDGLTLGMMATGAKGVISVSSNVAPARVSEVTSLVAAGRWEEARAAHLGLLPLHGAMFVEPNPAPAKAGLEMLGRMRADVRLPLVPATDGAREIIRAAISGLGML